MTRRSAARATLAGILAAATIAVAGCAAAPARIEEDAETGFAVYRSGRLSEGRLKSLCEQGVREMVVLSGTAANRECRSRNRVCPDLTVRYDREQRAEVPLDAGFLTAFDAWVAEARREGRKIAFHCRHGWHRAGRLTAYYRMRYQGWTPERAKEEMNRVGRFMSRHPYLEPQVDALADWIAGRPCAQEPRHCVTEAPFAAATARFSEDTCEESP